MPNASLKTLKKRPDFLAAAQTGERWVSPGFILQVRTHSPDSFIRYGITATRKVGGAVERNFIKRRFRTLLRQILPLYGRPGTDYVMIARSGSQTRCFALMAQDLEKGLKYLKKQSC